MKIRFIRGLAVLTLTAVLAAGVRAEEATDAQATQIFDQLDVGGLYKDNWLDLQELSGDNLKWLQYDTNYNNYVEKREFLAGYAKGIPQLRPTDAEALKLYQQLDADDKDGYLRTDGPLPRYKAYDIGGDNVLSATEFLNGYAREKGGESPSSPEEPSTPANSTNAGGAGSSSHNKAAGLFKIGDIVETTSNDGNWGKKYLNAAKIIGLQDGEPRYRLRSFTATDGTRDYYSYSQNVRRPQNAVYDEYDPRLLIGSWRIGTSVHSSEKVIASHVAYDRGLTIKADGTYIWKPGTSATITGRWIKSNRPEYPITLKQAYQGDDWGAGPHGKVDGVFNIKVHNLKIGSSFWGPPVGKVASVSPILAAPRGAAKASAKR